MKRSLSIFREESITSTSNKERRLTSSTQNLLNHHITTPTFRNNIDEEQVKLILLDFNSDENQQRLRNKFAIQSKGKLLWLANKNDNQKIETDFIPIEFAKDKDYVLRHLEAWLTKGRRYGHSQLIEQIEGDTLRDPDVLLLLSGIDTFKDRIQDILEIEKQVALRLLQKHRLDAILKYPFLSSMVCEMLEKDLDLDEDTYLLLEGLRVDIVREYNKPQQIFKIYEEDNESKYPWSYYLCKENRKIMLANACKYGLSGIHSNFFNDEEFLLEVFTKYRGVIRVVNRFTPNRELAPKMFEQLKKDPSFLLKAIQINPKTFLYADKSLKQDFEFFSKAIDVSAKILNHINFSPKIIGFLEKKIEKETIEERALNIAAFEPSLLKYIDSKLLTDRDFIVKFLAKIETLNKYKGELDLSILEQYLTSEMKEDEGLMFKFISLGWNSFLFASTKLRNDKEFLLKALKYNDQCGQLFPSELLDNKDFILECLNVTKNMFEFVSPRLKDDDFIVSISVTKGHSDLLYFVSDRLRRDKEFILELIKIGGDVRYWLDEGLIGGENIYTDSEFMLEVLEHMPNKFDLEFDYDLKNDRDFALKAVKLTNLNKFDIWLRNDKELQQQAATYQGSCFEFSEELFNIRMEHKYFGCKL